MSVLQFSGNRCLLTSTFHAAFRSFWMRYLFLSNVGKQRPSYSVEYHRRREFSSVNEKSLGHDYEGNVSLNY